MEKYSAAEFRKIRQRSQYTCMAASLSMCLDAFGIVVHEDEISSLMGVSSLSGGTWESAMAVGQYLGLRSAMISPCSLETVKRSTDMGYPVMITWNPENRDWSHASVIFDVSDDLSTVYIADPNIPNPNLLTRGVDSNEFYSKWFEKWPKFLFRRVALIFSREVLDNGAINK